MKICITTRTIYSFFLILFSIVNALPAFAATDTPSDGTPLLFTETHHTLAYNFKSFWLENGGLAVFGYPLTEVFNEGGVVTQYFERSRFEWHATTSQVMLGNLGGWASKTYVGNPAFVPMSYRKKNERDDYFVETQHTLANGFQAFWKARGGLPIFGFPISEEFQETNAQDGKIYTVQYFERARFEYHPEASEQFKVQLGLLGQHYLNQMSKPPSWATNPISDPAEAWNGIRPINIKIPRIAVDTDVEEAGFSLMGWDVPRYVAAHYWPVAGFPGTPGNIIIAGHSGYKNTIFDHLPQVTLGDKIVVKTSVGERYYKVRAIITTLPSETWVMNPTNIELLTLITCVPIGVFDHRLVVQASPLES